MNRFAIFTAALLLAASGTTANAGLVENPVPPAKAGGGAIGFSLEDMSRGIYLDGAGSREADFSRLTFKIGLGLGEGRLVELLVGTVSVYAGALFGETETGFEVGGRYRQKVSESNLGGKALATGFVLAVAGGNAENSIGEGTDFFQAEAGFGASLAIQEQLNVYGAVLLSSVFGTAYSDAGDNGFDEENTFGLAGGVEYQVQDNIFARFELHLVHESGYGVAVQVNL